MQKAGWDECRFTPFTQCEVLFTMASWWTAADTPECPDVEENSIVSRVVRTVGLFGDFLSLEDTEGEEETKKGVQEAEEEEWMRKRGRD